MNTKTDGICSGLVAMNETYHQPLTEEDWKFIFSVLDGTKLDVPRIRYEVRRLHDDLEESDAIRDRCAHLLAETAVALKGPEKALHRHGWQDIPEVAARQSAALKLAREALFDMQDSYAAVHGWKDSFVIAATTAIAAIDEVLKGE